MEPMLSLPSIQRRKKQYYAAIKLEVSPGHLGTMGPKSHKRLRKWLEANGIEPTGPPFFKYDRIDMAKGFNMEFGFPIAKAIREDETVVCGVLPAGRFAGLVFHWPYKKLFEANAVLIGWAKERGLNLIRW